MKIKFVRKANMFVETESWIDPKNPKRRLFKQTWISKEDKQNG